MPNLHSKALLDADKGGETVELNRGEFGQTTFQESVTERQVQEKSAIAPNTAATPEFDDDIPYLVENDSNFKDEDEVPLANARVARTPVTKTSVARTPDVEEPVIHSIGPPVNYAESCSDER